MMDIIYKDKIVTTSLVIYKNETYYRAKYSDDSIAWEWLIGESAETVYSMEDELEEAYQNAIKLQNC